MSRRSSTTSKGSSDRSRSITRDEIDAEIVALEQAVVGEPEQVEDLLDRFSRLPGKRTSDAIADRLIAGNSPVALLLLELLPAIGGVNAGQSALRRIARMAEASDALRIEAKRMAGWPEDGRAARRRTFLRSLRDQESALVGAAMLACNFWPLRPSMYEEVVEYLDVVTDEERLSIVRRIAAELPASGLPLLHAILHFPDRASQRIAIDCIGERGYRVSAAALQRLARTTRDAEIRDAANDAAGRLQTGNAGAATGSGDLDDAWLSLPPVDDVFVTVVDGSGGQSYQIARQREGEQGIFVSYLTVDRGGLWDYVGIDRLDPDGLAEILDRFDEASPTVDIDLAAVRGGIEFALHTNEATRTDIPPAFEIWEPFSHDEYPPTANEVFVLPTIDDTDTADDPARVARTGDLLNHGFFESWAFPYDLVSDAMHTTQPPDDGVLTDTQYKPLIAAVADDATIAQLRDWLQRQAWLLDRNGEDEARDLALAASASLRDSDPEARGTHPFLRALMDVSVAGVLNNPYAILEEMLMAHGISIMPGAVP